MTQTIDTSPLQPRIRPQDRVLISLGITILFLCFAALSRAPLHYTLGAIIAICALIHFYGKKLIAPPDVYVRKSKDAQKGALLRAQAVLDDFPEAVWVLGEQNALLYASPQAAHLFPNVKIGSRVNTLVRDPQFNDFIKDVFAEIPRAPLIYHADLPVERYLRLSGTRIAPSDGNGFERPHAVVAFHDVTDILKSSSMRSDFLANASHELKTPIASLLGYIETLQGHAKNDAEAREKFLVIMQSQAERMQRLINDLLSLRQIEQTQHLAPDETVSLQAVINAAIDVVSPLATTRGVKIDFQPQTNARDDIHVSGKNDELIQLCLNLLDNAVKISPEKSRITLTIGTTKSAHAYDVPEALIQDIAPTDDWQILPPPNHDIPYGYIRITDSGPGFPPEHLPRLGERFYRIASHVHKGTGLGLAIVKHIIMSHRGGLHVGTTPQAQDSQAQSGTCFTALIPLSRGAEPENTQSA
ncbi:MAG: sensor histidine kinase [Maricaulaceae bacterium]